MCVTLLSLQINATDLCWKQQVGTISNGEHNCFVAVVHWNAGNDQD